MSKGEILASLGEGRYRVRQSLAVDRINEELVRLNERIAELAILLPQKKLELLQAEDHVETTARAIDLAIGELNTGDDGALQKITRLQVTLVEQGTAVRLLEIRVNELIAENLSLLKRRNLLESVPAAREMEAWCADYTDSLAGEVGLIDINDEGGKPPIIQPGFAGEAGYIPVKDGALFPNLAQTALQLYYNAALLPGVQKYLPLYRVGTVTAIDGDTCDLLLDDARSSAQNLPINRRLEFSEVPIIYMNCNGAAFTDGDRVVVRITDFGPVVIGFEKEPVPCAVNDLICIPSKMESNDEPIGYGKPFEDGTGSPINPPLGTLGGTDRAWSFSPTGGSWTTVKGINHQLYGARNWAGNSENDVLSWNGPESRVCALYRWAPTEATNMAGAATVYWKGTALYSLGFSQSATLEGAAIAYKGNDRYLRICVSNAQWMHRGRDARSLALTISELYWPQGSAPFAPAEIASFEATHTYPPCSGAYFSRDGNSMVLTCSKDELGDCYVYRWDGGATISESHEQIDLEGGTETVVYESSDDREGTFQQGTVTSTRTRSGLASTAEATLYYDFRGNTEIQVSIKLPERTDSELRTTYYFYDLLQGGGSETENVLNSNRTRQCANLEIKSAGKTIFSLGPVESYLAVSSGEWGNLSGNSYGSLQYELDDLTVIPDLMTMIIDGRFELVGGYFSEIRQTVSSTESRDGDGSWSQSRTATNYSARHLVLWSAGAEVDRESYVIEDSSTSGTSDISKSNLSAVDDPYTEVNNFPYLISTKVPSIKTETVSGVVHVGTFAKSAGKAIASLEYDIPEVPDEDILRINYVTGVASPLSYFFGLPEDSRHVFDRVSLV